MIKPIAICCTFALLAAVVLALALSSSRTSKGVTDEQFRLLQPGMTQAEAERVLEGPPRNTLGHAAIIWLPQPAGRPKSAWIEPASPAVDFFVREDAANGGRQGLRVAANQDFFPPFTSKSGHQSVWITSTGLIAVYFGRDGKLEHKYMSTVDELVPPSFSGWLASRPRMIRQSFGL